MDYQCLELAVYRNSQHLLFELLLGSPPNSQRIAECEQLVSFHYSKVPYSEERLALFMMAALGMDMADMHLQKAFAEADWYAVVWILEGFFLRQQNGHRQLIGVKIVVLLLGINEFSQMHRITLPYLNQVW